MKTGRLCSLLVAAFSLLPTLSRGDQQAHARLYCVSLSFPRGSDATTEYSLELDMGELWYYNSSSYAANVTLHDDWFGDSVPGAMLLAIPGFVDANLDGFPDFFDSSQAIGTTGTAGSYNLAVYGSGTLQATWSRAAGTSWGSCVLRFRPGNLYTWLTFNLSFQVQEYSGPLAYYPGATTVTGRVDLVQTDAPDSLYGGPATFVKTTTNRFNALILQPDVWTNASQLPFAYTNSLFLRDTLWPTNYYGFVIFDDDANPATAYAYDYWVLSIDDLHDADHDGIPDFSDDPAGPLRRPRLSLARGATDLQLTIAGDIGHLHQVLEASSLTATNWVTVWSQVLTNDPQVVSLPAPGPAAARKFWRVLAQ